MLKEQKCECGAVISIGDWWCSSCNRPQTRLPAVVGDFPTLDQWLKRHSAIRRWVTRLEAEGTRDRVTGETKWRPEISVESWLVDDEEILILLSHQRMDLRMSRVRFLIVISFLVGCGGNGDCAFLLDGHDSAATANEKERSADSHYPIAIERMSQEIGYCESG